MGQVALSHAVRVDAVADVVLCVTSRKRQLATHPTTSPAGNAQDHLGNRVDSLPRGSHLKARCTKIK